MDMVIVYLVRLNFSDCLGKTSLGDVQIALVTTSKDGEDITWLNVHIARRLLATARGQSPQRNVCFNDRVPRMHITAFLIKAKDPQHQIQVTVVA